MSDLSSATIVQITGERADGSTWRIDLTPQEWRAMLDCTEFGVHGVADAGAIDDGLCDDLWEKLK